MELSRDMPASININGSYKSLLTAGKTLSGKDFWGDLNRLRLEFDIKPMSSILAKAVYDNEVTIGEILGREEFIKAKKASDDALYDLSKNLIDNPDLFWRHTLYRLYAAYFMDSLNFTIGRQRIAWGQARIWNPTDLFNPISPLQIEWDQRPGVDAIDLEYSIGPLSSVNVVYAPGDVSEKSSGGARLKTNVKNYDLSLMLGEFRKDKVVGFDFAGNIGGSGFRGEGTFTDNRGGKDFTRFVVSWDYNFPSTFYLLFEYLYNGGNLGKGATVARIAEFSGEIATKNRNFLAFGAGYDVTPLIKLNSHTIYDLEGRGLFFNPVMTYNIFNNIEWITGAQIYSEDKDSDFFGLPNIYYASLEWFF